MKPVFRMALPALLTLAPISISAAEPWTMDGRKTIELHTRDGKAIPIGTVDFRPDGDETKFKISINDEKFTVYFLSMRNFKCIEGPDVECWVPYPYDNPMTATKTNLNWLADNLLFLFKTKQEAGATMTNGIRYNLKLTPDGIVGKPQAINLDDIASPPKDPTVAPYPPADRDDYPEGDRWVNEMTIR